jgi:hypothetical protein
MTIDNKFKDDDRVSPKVIEAIKNIENMIVIFLMA